MESQFNASVMVRTYMYILIHMCLAMDTVDELHELEGAVCMAQAVRHCQRVENRVQTLSEIHVRIWPTCTQKKHNFSQLM